MTIDPELHKKKALDVQVNLRQPVHDHSDSKQWFIHQPFQGGGKPLTVYLFIIIPTYSWVIYLSFQMICY